MSFFKDFKEDLSQAVNELVPGEDTTEAAEQDNDVVVSGFQWNQWNLKLQSSSCFLLLANQI